MYYRSLFVQCTMSSIVKCTPSPSLVSPRTIIMSVSRAHKEQDIKIIIINFYSTILVDLLGKQRHSKDFPQNSANYNDVV